MKNTNRTIYLAGASREIDLIEKYQRAVRDLGFIVTHDWCADVRLNIASGRTDADLSIDEAREYASRDLNGIGQAMTVWLLIPEEPSIGCWAEWGYAKNIRSEYGGILIASGNWRKSLFACLADIVFADHDEALEGLKKLRDEVLR